MNMLRSSVSGKTMNAQSKSDAKEQTNTFLFLILLRHFRNAAHKRRFAVCYTFRVSSVFYCFLRLHGACFFCKALSETVSVAESHLVVNLRDFFPLFGAPF